jgi:uncharacterized protein YodC (DUF2158 family)
MTDTFQVGDVVKLTSGGPKNDRYSSGDVYGRLTVWCAWLVSTKQENGLFPVGAVETATEESTASIQTTANRRPRRV